MARTPVRILLARHGETIANVEGRWQGQSDSPLTERGLAQASELGRALSRDSIAAVYSSDLGRAMTTAGLVAKPHKLVVQSDVRLREIHVGGFTGLGRAEIDQRYPGMRAAWASEPAGVRLPDGETLAEVQSRVLTFFGQRLADHAGETVVVISHGATGQTILADAMGLTVEALWLKERIDNCQISRLEWAADTGLKLIEMSDVRHLQDVGSLRGWRTHAESD